MLTAPAVGLFALNGEISCTTPAAMELDPAHPRSSDGARRDACVANACRFRLASGLGSALLSIPARTGSERGIRQSWRRRSSDSSVAAVRLSMSHMPSAPSAVATYGSPAATQRASMARPSTAEQARQGLRRPSRALILVGFFVGSSKLSVTRGSFAIDAAGASVRPQRYLVRRRQRRCPAPRA